MSWCRGWLFWPCTPARRLMAPVSDSVLTESLERAAGRKCGPRWGLDGVGSITCILPQIPYDLDFINRDWPGALLQEDRGCSLLGLRHADPCAAPAPPAAPALCGSQSQSPGEPLLMLAEGRAFPGGFRTFCVL